MNDLRYALRSLRKNTGVTIAAVLVLAVGIGANTAVFSAVYAVLLKPLAYRNPERLVVALHDGRFPVSPADFLDYKAQSSVFTELGAAQAANGALEFNNRAEIVPALQITSNMVPMLGVPPMIGRSFLTREETPGENQVLLLSYRLWQRHFGSDRNIAGRRVRVSDKDYTIVGVMPRDFQFAPFWQTEAEMWMPLALGPRRNDRAGSSLRVFGRLKPGVSVDEAQSQMSTIAARLASAYPATNAGLGIQVISLHDKVAGPMRPTLLILLGTVGFVLIIACADIGNLLLARAASRRKEIATRIALGATRFQLSRQLAVESLVLAGLGGAVGILLAMAGLDLLRVSLPVAGLPRQDEIVLNGTVLLFATLISIVVGLASGMIPALEGSHIDVNEHLKEAGRGSSESRGMRRTQGALITAQVSLALVLLVCAGLLTRSLRHLNAVDAGFDPSHVLTFEARAPEAHFDSPAKRAALFQRIESSLKAMPDVESASAINHLPIGGDIWSFGYDVPGRPAPPVGQGYGAVYRVVRPGYFQTMRIPLLRGRDITVHDDEHAPPVAVVNAAMAHRQWPSGDALGRQIIFREPGVPPLTVTIVGVIKNARQSDWTGPIDDEVYLPYLQRPGAFGMTSETFVVRTRNEPELLAARIERDAPGIGSDVPLSQLRTMDRVIADKLWRSRVSTILLSVFAIIALGLAAAGIYSVICYSVRRRTQEMGIRIALGASSRTLLGLILRESFAPVGLGIAIGMAAAFAAVRVLGTLLYDVPPNDPLTFAAVVIGLIATGVAATCYPVWRVMKTDPLAALRHGS